MARVEFDDGTVMWRRGLVAKALWGVGVAAWSAVAAFGTGIEPNERVLFLVGGAGAALVAWAQVWRPHLAATPDGLVVRRAMSAVLVRWHDVAEVHVWGSYGVRIMVRAGRPLSSVVPRRAALWWFLNLESEADEAARCLNEWASRHREPPDHPAVTVEPGLRRSAGERQASTATKASNRLTAGHRRLIALAVLVVSVTVGALLINQTNRIDASVEQLRHTGVATPAHVADVRSALRSTWWSVEYTYAGTTYRQDISCSKSCFERGERITIYVDPQNPARFITDSGRGSMPPVQLLVAILTLAGMAALFAAGYLVRQWVVGSHATA